LVSDFQSSNQNWGMMIRMCHRLGIFHLFCLPSKRDAKFYKCSKITSRSTKQRGPGGGVKGGCFRVKGEKTPSIGSAGEQEKGDKYSKQGGRHLFARGVEINGAEIWILMSPQREKFLKENKQCLTERDKGVKRSERTNLLKLYFTPNGAREFFAE
jgi:hypothetical protein